jgi:flagellar secretion chaperone FliS
MSMANPYNYSKPAGVTIPGGLLGKSGEPDSSGKALDNIKRNSATDKYLEQKVMSARPEELTLMLYDGIIKFLGQVKIFNDQNDAGKSHNANIRAQMIIEELRATLNPAIEMAKGLDDIYEFMTYRLFEANVKKSNSMVDEVLDLAKDLRDTWKEAFKL